MCLENIHKYISKTLNITSHSKNEEYQIYRIVCYFILLPMTIHRLTFNNTTTDAQTIAMVTLCIDDVHFVD